MRKIILLLIIMFSSFQATTKEIATKVKEPFEIENSEVFTINSNVLSRKYNIYIKVPSDYFNKDNSQKTYPALYLNDGPHTFKVAAGVTHFKSMNKAIVVGIAFAQGEDGQYSRVRDLTPEPDESWSNYVTGGASDYLRFIENEVIPFVEKNYRANPARRILCGHSLGGSFGTWVLLTKPQLFSGYILTSPSLWFKDEMIFDLEEKYAQDHESLAVNVYFATGALETPENGMKNNMVDGHNRFVKRMRSRNYQGLHLNDEVVPGTDHFSTFPVGLAKGLRWIYQDLW